MSFSEPLGHEDMKDCLLQNEFVHSVGDAGNAIVTEQTPPLRASNTFGNIARKYGWIVVNVTHASESRFITFAPANEVLDE